MIPTHTWTSPNDVDHLIDDHGRCATCGRTHPRPPRPAHPSTESHRDRCPWCARWHKARPCTLCGRILTPSGYHPDSGMARWEPADRTPNIGCPSLPRFPCDAGPIPAD